MTVTHSKVTIWQQSWDFDLNSLMSKAMPTMSSVICYIIPTC